MTSNTRSVRDLAAEAGLDNDEALVTLWGAGIESVLYIDDRLKGNALKAACKALNIQNAKQMQTLSYWSTKWDIDENETRERLRKYGIQVSANARTLPKGALKKLRQTPDAFPPVEDTAPAVPLRALTEIEPKYVERTPGHKKEIKNLTAQEVLMIHEALVEDFSRTADPIDPPGARDMNLLESAAFRPATALGSENKYPTIEMAAAALLHSLVLNHAFHNGNKRTAIVSMLVFLDRHDMLLTCDEGELFREVLLIAQHQLVPTGWSSYCDREVVAIADWICKCSRPLEHRVKILKWNDLKQILTSLGCRVGTPSPGNKIKIYREVPERGLFGLKRQRTLTRSAQYQSGGSEVGQETLAWIRKGLHLDDDHGYDSTYFYRDDKRTPDEFIAQYRTLLKRLAKL